MTPPGQPPTPDERELYKLYRDRITAEDALVHDRLTWLLITQSILFAFCATSYFSKERLDWAGLALVAGLGAATCAMIHIGIRAALATIEGVKARYHDNSPTPHPLLPPLTAAEVDHRRACWSPRYLPVLFIGGWLLVLILAWLTSVPAKG